MRKLRVIGARGAHDSDASREKQAEAAPAAGGETFEGLDGAAGDRHRRFGLRYLDGAAGSDAGRLSYVGTARGTARTRGAQSPAQARGGGALRASAAARDCRAGRPRTAAGGACGGAAVNPSFKTRRARIGALTLTLGALFGLAAIRLAILALINRAVLARIGRTQR